MNICNDSLISPIISFQILLISQFLVHDKIQCNQIRFNAVQHSDNNLISFEM